MVGTKWFPNPPCWSPSCFIEIHTFYVSSHSITLPKNASLNFVCGCWRHGMGRGDVPSRNTQPARQPHVANTSIVFTSWKRATHNIEGGASICVRVEGILVRDPPSLSFCFTLRCHNYNSNFQQWLHKNSPQQTNQAHKYSDTPSMALCPNCSYSKGTKIPTTPSQLGGVQTIMLAIPPTLKML